MMSMAPSLVNLCADSLKLELLRGEDEDLIRAVYDLPTELFDCVLSRLPALALHTLHLQLPQATSDDDKFDIDCLVNGRKRARCSKFNAVWMELFNSRWPEIFLQFKENEVYAKEEVVKLEAMVDWQQKYWETHLQSCLDAAAEMAMLPNFSNCLAEIRIPDKLLKPIGYEWHINGSTPDYLKLLGHCQQFGRYARFLRLQNVHCTAEASHLLRGSKLESVVIRKINTKMQVDGLCEILVQNIEMITSLEFIDCKLSSVFMDAIYDALHSKSAYIHGLEEFAIRASKLYEVDSTTLPVRLVSLVLSGRSLARFSLCDNEIERNLTSLIMKTISDCVCYQLSSHLDVGSSLQSLQVLNLRGNNLTKHDIKDLKSALMHMPMLETLDLGDNPFGDDIIRCLIPKLTKTSKSTPLANLYLNNCRISRDGATELLEVLSESNYPLKSLSLADNNLGSDVAAPLAKFLGTPISTLHVGDIGLYSDGFLELERRMGEMVNIVSINISANRGGIEAAKFVAKLLRCAPNLVSVIAAYNIMPQESLKIIYSALKAAKGNLQHLDLMGNPRLVTSSHFASKFGKFRYNGKPIVMLPNDPVLNAPYDDDP